MNVGCIPKKLMHQAALLGNYKYTITVHWRLHGQDINNVRMRSVLIF